MILGALTFFGSSATRYVGGDISLLPEYEKAGAVYKNGTATIPDFLVYCHDEAGMNAMRVRLFVDPDNYPSNDPNACQDLEYIIPLCKRIKDAGYALMLDFHYSDTWADPVKQWTPKAWLGLSDEELNGKIYSYTKETLQALAAEGIVPDMIQTGNEISYGMMWGDTGNSAKKAYFNSMPDDNNYNANRFGDLLNNAIKACREECPDAKIVLHSERVANTTTLVNFYDWMKKKGIDYDIIGLSYYPYYHNKLSQLDASLTALESRAYGKDIMIVETGWSYAWGFDDATYAVDYDASEAGQNQFAEDLVALAKKHKSCTGIFWWWMEYNAYGTNLAGWYNAPLVDSRTGRVQKALTTLASFANDDGEEEDPELPETYPDFYLLYNNGGDWNLPGDLLTHDGEGHYSISNVSIAGANNGKGYFALTTSNSDSDWVEINSHRYGPAVNTPVTLDSDLVVVATPSSETSWNVDAGIYNLTFDFNNMLLRVAESTGEGDTTGIENVDGIDSDTPVYYNLQGIRVDNPTRGIYLRVLRGKATKVIL